MEIDPRDTTLERNVGRLVRRWADPLHHEQVDEACQKFLRRLAAPTPQAPPKTSSAGRLGLAAALLLGAITFWAIFSWRDDAPPPSGAGVAAAPAQADDDPEIRALFAKLCSPSFEEQGRAAEALERLGIRSAGALERATKHENPQLRDWAAKILERVRKSDAALRERVAALIRKLSSDDFAEQGRAAEELRKIGKEAVDPLKTARDQSADPGLKEWIDRLLMAIEKGPPPPRPAQREREPREALVARGGGALQTESALLTALKWLAHHQGPDGGWGAVSFQNQCVGDRCGGPGERDYDTGLTAISLLAFLGAGYSQLSKEEYPDPVTPARALKFGEIVKKGIQWLLVHQDRDGCLGPREMKYMYNHAAAALCLSEAYGMTAAQVLREPAQKAIDFLVAAQNPGKGWRYSSRSGDNDTSVTGWAVFALRSAELSELRFPKSGYAGALNWINDATLPEGYFPTGYNARGTGKVFMPGKNDHFDHHPTMSAIAVLSRIFMGGAKTEPALSSVNLIAMDPPEWKANKVDLYYWHYGSLALFQYDGPAGPMWKMWNEPMKNALVPNQETAQSGCRQGSWDPGQERWGAEGGRIYTTAMAALILETYYRYPRVWDEKK